MLKFAKTLVLSLFMSNTSANEVSLRQVLASSPVFDEDLIKQVLVRHDINHLMLTDVNKLIAKIALEFSEVVQLSTIGSSWEGRPILMLTVDVIGNAPIKKKPAMLLTGAHHAREFVSTQMPLFSLLKMLHGGLLHGDEKYFHLLTQNKYYVVPVVNVDGLADIESIWETTGEFLPRRKNMNPMYHDVCDSANRGVDLNRNYAMYWNEPGGNSPEPCAENFRGIHPFSEPETRAIRDLLRSHKDEIKFVYNFHSYGNMYLWPFNAKNPNNISQKNPDVLDVFMEIWNASTFPEGTIKGSAWEALKYTSSGEQSDWILGELGIPSICPEIGSSDFFSYMWNIPFRRVMVNVLEENLNWLENTYDKIGNQIEVEAIGYEKLSNDKALLYFKVQNKGLSDQLVDEFEIKLGNNVHMLFDSD